jgi:hypothetical protein
LRRLVGEVGFDGQARLVSRAVPRCRSHDAAVGRVSGGGNLRKRAGAVGNDIANG